MGGNFGYNKIFPVKNINGTIFFCDSEIILSCKLMWVWFAELLWFSLFDKVFETYK